MSSSALKQSISTSKPTKNTTAASSVLAQNHNPSIDTNGANRTSAPPLTLSQEDTILSGATHLTRPEVLRRRSHNLKQLIRCYKDHYWALMEELKIQYREYYWKYGVSPIVERQPQQLENGAVEREGDDNNVIAEGTGENVNNSNNNINGNSNYNNNNNNNNNNNIKSGGLDLTNNKRCLFVGCKLKAMAMTSFCHLHILSDSKQKLYKPCDYVIKSAQAGPITCGKPILRSTVPSLCSVHFQKAQKHVTRALKKAGLNVTSSSKLAPKFHVIVAEYVHQIQARRRNMLKRSKSKLVVKEETTSEASS